MKDLSDLGKSNAEKFLEEYNALVEKYGIMLEPKVNLGFQLTKKPKE
jgi:hypothetical protein